MLANSSAVQLKIVYCLNSSGGDLYEAMTRESLATLRLTNPSARITIACDQQTHQALQACGSQLFREAAGPFLFLDSYTVVRKPLDRWLDLGAMGYEHLR